MISKAPISRFISATPESFKRLLRFARNPSQHLDSAFDPDLEHALLDYFKSLAIVAGVLTALAYFLPGYLEINPIDIQRTVVLLTLFTVNAVTFSLCLWFVSLIVLLFARVQLHGAIFYQGIKASAFLNIPAAIIFVIAVNRIVVNGDINNATGTGDSLLATVAAISAFALSIWLLILPIGRYLRSRYRPAIAYPLGLAICALASLLNPIIAPDYFSIVLDKGKLCEQVISTRKKAELQSGAIKKDEWVGKCEALFDEKSPRLADQPKR